MSLMWYVQTISKDAWLLSEISSGGQCLTWPQTPAVCTSLQVRATVPKMILDDVFTVSGTVAEEVAVI